MSKRICIKSARLINQTVEHKAENDSNDGVELEASERLVSETEEVAPGKQKNTSKASTHIPHCVWELHSHKGVIISFYCCISLFAIFLFPIPNTVLRI